MGIGHCLGPGGETHQGGSAGCRASSPGHSEAQPGSSPAVPRLHIHEDLLCEWSTELAFPLEGAASSGMGGDGKGLLEGRVEGGENSGETDRLREGTKRHGEMWDRDT